jgi:hypothetical protein
MKNVPTIHLKPNPRTLAAPWAGTNMLFTSALLSFPAMIRMGIAKA